MEGMDIEAAQATSRHMAARAEVLERLCATAVAALEQAHTDEIGRIVDELNERIRKQQVVSNG